MGKKDIITAIVIAMLGFIGALAGSVVSPIITGNYNEKLWERQNVIEQKNHLLKERIKILERVTKVLNSKAKARDYRETLKYFASEAAEFSDCIKQVNSHKSLIDCKAIFNINGASETIQQMNDLDGEFAASIQLASIYFGAETAKLCSELALIKRWWLSDDSLSKKLLRAMQNELQEYKIVVKRDIAVVE